MSTSEPSTSTLTPDSSPGPLPAAGRERARSPIAAATALAEEIGRCAVRLSDGSVTWLLPGTVNGRPRPVGPHVYDGTTGVALFLGAFHHVTGEKAAGDLARHAVAPLRRKLRELVRAPERAQSLRLGVGGLVGLGSFLYAFVRLARWLQDEALLAEARQLTALLTPERIAGDERLDVMNGAAGALLALLALEREAPGPGADGRSPLAVAVDCGRHLLGRRVSWKGMPKAWPGPDRPPITGFAHGAAGIAYALSRLHQCTGDRRLEAAAREGFAFERALYQPRQKNWLDTRSGRLLEQSAWCHGAPGIALGRFAALAAVDEPELREDAETAIEITRAGAIERFDHLCCGNLGRVEILLLAERALGREDLGREGRDLADRVLARYRSTGRFRLDPTGVGVDSVTEESPPLPMLFFGLAGIGYVLLRVAGRDELPSPLLLG